MAFDNATGSVVMFGGSGGFALGDTWEFDGSTWSQTSAGGPPPRSGGALCYRPSTQTMTLVGGTIGSPLTDAWNYQSGTWIQIPSSHTGDLSRCYSSALHPTTDEIIATGTASLPRTVTARLSGYTNIGPGCTCDGQVMPFEVNGVGPTNVGLTFTLAFANYAIGNPIWAVWDVAPSAFSPQIPFLPAGCVANLAGIASAALVSAAPSASTPPNYFLAIPNNTALIGIRIVYQGLQLNLGSYLGCTSSAVDMRIGR